MRKSPVPESSDLAWNPSSPPLPICVALGESLRFFGPQFFPLQNGDDSRSLFILLSGGFNDLIAHTKGIEEGPAHIITHETLAIYGCTRARRMKLHRPMSAPPASQP